MRGQSSHANIDPRPATVRQSDGRVFEREEELLEETPISIAINGKAYAVMMVTPGDIEDFLFGFLFADGLIRYATDVLAWEIVESQNLYTAYVQLTESMAQTARERARGVIGASSCGLCGVPRMDERLEVCEKITTKVVVSIDEIAEALKDMQSGQEINRRTGTAHAAILIEGSHRVVREDIGRHNAVDKVAGWAVRHAWNPSNLCLLAVSSRLTFEIIHKAARLRVPIVAAISGVSGLAARTAERAGITVVAYAREGRMTIYTHKERIVRERINT
ncbi:formate dehydrogenase accessory sulfurtransferase FdhD [Acidiferrobacter sp.]